MPQNARRAEEINQVLLRNADSWRAQSLGDTSVRLQEPLESLKTGRIDHAGQRLQELKDAALYIDAQPK